MPPRQRQQPPGGTPQKQTHQVGDPHLAPAASSKRRLRGAGGHSPKGERLRMGSEERRAPPRSDPAPGGWGGTQCGSRGMQGVNKEQTKATRSSRGEEGERARARAHGRPARGQRHGNPRFWVAAAAVETVRGCGAPTPANPPPPRPPHPQPAAAADWASRGASYSHPSPPPLPVAAITGQGQQHPPSLPHTRPAARTVCPHAPPTPPQAVESGGATAPTASPLPLSRPPLVAGRAADAVAPSPLPQRRNLPPPPCSWRQAGRHRQQAQRGEAQALTAGRGALGRASEGGGPHRPACLPARWLPPPPPPAPYPPPLRHLPSDHDSPSAPPKPSPPSEGVQSNVLSEFPSLLCVPPPCPPWAWRIPLDCGEAPTSSAAC